MVAQPTTMSTEGRRDYGTQDKKRAFTGSNGWFTTRWYERKGWHFNQSVDRYYGTVGGSYLDSDTPWPKINEREIAMTMAEGGPCGNCTHPQRDHMTFVIEESSANECVSCFHEDRFVICSDYSDPNDTEPPHSSKRIMAAGRWPNTNDKKRMGLWQKTHQRLDLFWPRNVSEKRNAVYIVALNLLPFAKVCTVAESVATRTGTTRISNSISCITRDPSGDQTDEPRVIERKEAIPLYTKWY